MSDLACFLKTDLQVTKTSNLFNLRLVECMVDDFKYNGYWCWNSTGVSSGLSFVYLFHIWFWNHFSPKHASGTFSGSRVSTPV